MAKRYTFTLKSMVETIDEHGLKTKFLSKHRRNAENFLDWVAKREVSSEVTRATSPGSGSTGSGSSRSWTTMASRGTTTMPRTHSSSWRLAGGY